MGQGGKEHGSKQKEAIAVGKTPGPGVQSSGRALSQDVCAPQNKGEKPLANHVTNTSGKTQSASLSRKKSPVPSQNYPHPDSDFYSHRLGYLLLNFMQTD